MDHHYSQIGFLATHIDNIRPDVDVAATLDRLQIRDS